MDLRHSRPLPVRSPGDVRTSLAEEESSTSPQGNRESSILPPTGEYQNITKDHHNEALLPASHHVNNRTYGKFSFSENYFCVEAYFALDIDINSYLLPRVNSDLNLGDLYSTICFLRVRNLISYPRGVPNRL